jgi:hypothetical protein
LYHVVETSGIHDPLRGHLNDTRTLLELHKASTVSISEDESILDSIGLRSSTLLREQMESSGALQNPPLFREVSFGDHVVLVTFRIWNIEYMLNTIFCIFSLGGTCSVPSLLRHIGPSNPQVEH